KRFQYSEMRTQDLRFKGGFVGSHKLHEARDLEHIFADKANCVRVNSLYYRQVSENLGGTVVLESDVQLNRSLQPIRLELTYSSDRLSHALSNKFICDLRRKSSSGMESEGPLDYCTFDWSDGIAHLFDCSVVAGNHYDRHVEVAGDRGVHRAFSHRHAVEPHVSQSRA